MRRLPAWIVIVVTAISVVTAATIAATIVMSVMIAIIHSNCLIPLLKNIYCHFSFGNAESLVSDANRRNRADAVSMQQYPETEPTFTESHLNRLRSVGQSTCSDKRTIC